MRDIICRGKCSIHREKHSIGEWVEGVYIRIPKGRFEEEEYLIQPIKRDGKLAMLENVEPDTVGQYTGLTDKNGVKIFEGDIVKIALAVSAPRKHICMLSHDVTYEVAYSCDRAMFVCVNGIYGFPLELYKSDECYEVIGNIHDNPELLARNEEAHHEQAED